MIFTRAAPVLIRRCNSDANRKRYLTLDSAKQMLGLKNYDSLTTKQVRHAYFRIAKGCHPDLQDAAENNGQKNNSDFIKLTEAYETLVDFQQNGGDPFDVSIISMEEERRYREACEDWLGLSAEIVEESKKCSMFRDWLADRNHNTYRWKVFFAANGGLAPKLRPKPLLENNNEPKPLRRRRRRQTC